MMMNPPFPEVSEESCPEAECRVYHPARLPGESRKEKYFRLSGIPGPKRGRKWCWVGELVGLVVMAWMGWGIIQKLF